MTSYARGRTLPVLVAVAALVGAANLGAYAATGHPILLGRANHAVATTTLSTTGHSPALTLRTSKKAPPLAVSSGKVVKHLNADRVDGLNARDLGSTAITYRLPNGPTQVSLRLPPPGTYLLSVSAELTDSSPGQCWVEQIGATSVEPITFFGTAIGSYNTISGSTVVTLGKNAEALNFRCFSPLYSTKVNPSTIALVRIPTHRTGHLVQ